ncbi:MAG: peroxiredoxin [Bradymonadia bacterium]
MSIQVGDTLPAIPLHEGNPKTTVSLPELFAGKKGVLFAVRGAFTPGCSKTHLPGYVADFEALQHKGIDVVVCVSVNDAFVMDAWGKAHGADGKVRMLADPAGDFTKAVGLDVNAAVLGGLRSTRYSMVIEDGKVKSLNVEPDGFGLTCSLSNALLEQL